MIEIDGNEHRLLLLHCSSQYWLRGDDSHSIVFAALFPIDQNPSVSSITSNLSSSANFLSPCLNDCLNPNSKACVIDRGFVCSSTALPPKLLSLLFCDRATMSYYSAPSSHGRRSQRKRVRLMLSAMAQSCDSAALVQFPSRACYCSIEGTTQICALFDDPTQNFSISELAAFVTPLQRILMDRR